MQINTHWGDDTVNIDNAIIPSLKWFFFLYIYMFYLKNKGLENLIMGTKMLNQYI